MKKLLFILTLGFIFGTINAQDLKSLSKPDFLKQRTPVLNPERTNFKNHTKNASREYLYGYDMMNIHNDWTMDNLWEIMPLFPDTNISTWYNDSNFSKPWIHSIANVLDIRSPQLNDAAYYSGEMQYQAGANYTINTVGIYGIYLRANSDENIIDTLEFEIVTNYNSVPFYSFPEKWGYLYGVTGSSVTFVDVQASTNINKQMNFSSTQKFIKLLDKNSVNDDISPLFYEDDNFFYVTPNVNVGNMGYFIAAVQFKPGDPSYSKLDTLGVNQNVFFPYAVKEMNNYQMIDSYELGIYNASYNYETRNKYNSNSQVYRLYRNLLDFYTENINDAGDMFDHWLMSYSISCSNCGFVGVEETEAKNISVYPNPAQNTVSVQLPDMTPAQIEIINLVGQTVISQPTASETVKLDISTLNQGVYMIQIRQEGKVYTSKLVVK